VFDRLALWVGLFLAGLVGIWAVVSSVVTEPTLLVQAIVVVAVLALVIAPAGLALDVIRWWEARRSGPTRAVLAFRPAVEMKRLQPYIGVRRQIADSGFVATEIQPLVPNYSRADSEVANLYLDNRAQEPDAWARNTWGLIDIYAPGDVLVAHMRARFAESKQPRLQANAADISDVMDIPPTKWKTFDVAFKPSSEPDAYALNTAAMSEHRDWKKPEWRLPPGQYLVHAEARWDPRRTIRAWFALSNDGADGSLQLLSASPSLKLRLAQRFLGWSRRDR
jgi:hypothetical protein